MLECAVALILLVDISGSVSPENYQLQHDGIAIAFSDARVQEAINMHPNGIAVSVIEWGESQYISVPWTIVKTKEDSMKFSAKVMTVERPPTKENTSIGEAMLRGIEYFNSVPCKPDHKVIDVSGDGSNNTGQHPELSKELAITEGIVINGLAIVTPQEPELYDYYKKNVITPDGFVLRAQGFEDFPRTIRRKLITEISNNSTSDINTDLIGPI